MTFIPALGNRCQIFQIVDQLTENLDRQDHICQLSGFIF
jgi:hypothetical protein